jgi:hypothetical protein
MTMPAISASRKAASSAASVLKSRAGARMTKEAAERLFMPAFSVATEKVIIPAYLKHQQTRSFSSARQHDKAYNQLHGSAVSDYWNSHKNEHFNLYKVDSEMLRHFNSQPSLVKLNSASTNQGLEDKGLIDMWSEHKNEHFAQPAKDYWTAHANEHL